MDSGCCAGIVCDLSHRGLFIQTLAKPMLNSIVEVIFPASRTRAEIRIEAGVARKRCAPRQLQSALPSGLGLEILAPRNEYERYVFRPACPQLRESAWLADSFDPHPKQLTRAYRFHLTRLDRVGSQILSVRCESEASARARALSRAGAGWKITDVQPL